MLEHEALAVLCISPLHVSICDLTLSVAPFISCEALRAGSPPITCEIISSFYFFTLVWLLLP